MCRSESCCHTGGGWDVGAPAKGAGVFLAAVLAGYEVLAHAGVLLVAVAVVAGGTVVITAGVMWWLRGRMIRWHADPAPSMVKLQRPLQAAPAPVTLAAETYRPPLPAATPLAVGPARRVVPGVVAREAGKAAGR